MSNRLTNFVEMRVDGEDFDISPFVDEFVWVESLIKGGFSWGMRFNTNFWNEWNDLLLGQEQPRVFFRMRSYVEDEESSTEWRRAITDWARASFDATASMSAMICGADKRLDMAQFARNRAWRSSTVSEIINSVAAEAGLVPDAVPTIGRRDRWQVQESDWDFIKRLADSTQIGGRGDVYLWMDEDTLRLRTITSQGRSIRRHDLSVIESRMDGFAVQYSGRMIDRMGGATLLGIGFDFDKKTGIPFLLNSAQSATHPALASRVPRLQEGGLRYHPMSEDQRDTVEEVTRGRWGSLAPRYLSLKAMTRADVTLSAGRIIETLAATAEGRETPVQGRYHLLEVKHHYVKGDTTTSAIGYRREMIDGAQLSPGASAENVGTRDRHRIGQTNPRPVVLIAEEI